jgi:hypothetical protein
MSDLEKALPIHLYGVDNAKSLSCLINEIKQGETEITWINEVPIRVINVARVYVYYKDKQLVETKQLIKQQGIRYRNINCISEKFKLNELPIDAALRGLSEELAIAVSSNNLNYLTNSKEERYSPSYPGLLTRYNFFDYIFIMKDELYNPSGYVADEGDCVTYFNWV